MRTVHVSDCFAPRIGGIETQVAALARAQGARGHDVTVVTATAAADSGDASADPDDAADPGHAAADPDAVADSGDASADPGVPGLPGAACSAGGRSRRVRVVRLAGHRLGTLPVNLRGRRELSAAFERLAPDVIHVHAGMVSPFAVQAVVVALETGRPLVVTWHSALAGPIPRLLDLPGSARLADNSALPLRWPDQLADAARAGRAVLTAVSDAAARPVRARTGAVVAVVPDLVDLAPWREVARTRPAPAAGRPLRIIAAMRLAPRKQIGTVLAAAYRLRRTVPVPFTVDVFGRGILLGPARAAVRLLRLRGTVTLHGAVDPDRLRREYATAQILLAPAALETFGIAALEARAAGLAVVADTRSGIASFITDGIDGLLATGRRGLTAALKRLVTDDVLRRRILRHTAVAPPDLDAAGSLDAFDALYDRARAARSARPAFTAGAWSVPGAGSVLGAWSVPGA